MFACSIPLTSDDKQICDKAFKEAPIGIGQDAFCSPWRQSGLHMRPAKDNIQ